MVESGIGALWCTALLAIASAGPLARFPRDVEDYQGELSAYVNFTANEVCFSDNEVFQKGAQMPNPGPCEECRCEPPSIVCNMIKCPVNNNGCRTLQRPNHCCPDYNCECDYNGQLYNDGELVDVPEQPCQVCYCKGGDVMCNSLKCYQRDDCPPVLVPGQCCPKYENCPVRDTASSAEKNNQSRSPNNHLNNQASNEMQPWLLTKSVMQTSSLPLPKPAQDATTEDVNTIIVSDWLTERRTTTEDTADQGGSRHASVDTDGSTVVTDSAHQTTLQHHRNTQRQEESSLVMTSGTLTPLDEVIFTRIDMLQVNHEDNMAISTNAPIVSSGDVEFDSHQRDYESNAKTFTLNENEDEFTTKNTLSSNDDVISLEVKKESNEMSQSKNALSSNTSLKDGLASTNSVNTTDTTSSVVKEISAEETVKNEPVKTQPEQTSSGYKTEPSMKGILKNSGSEETSNQTKKASQEENTKNDSYGNMDMVNDSKDFQLSEEITLEHLFGFDKAGVEEMDQTRTETSTIESKRNDYINIATEENKSDLLSELNNKKEYMEKSESFTTEESFHGNYSPKEMYWNDDMEAKKSQSDKIIGSMSDKTVFKLEETPDYTANLLEETDTTTPFFTENPMSGLIPESDKLLQGNMYVDKDSSKYDDYTTESARFPISTEPKLTKENIIIKKYDKPNTDIDNYSSTKDLSTPLDDGNMSDLIFSTPQYPSANANIAVISLKDGDMYEIQEFLPNRNTAADTSSKFNLIQSNEPTEKSSQHFSISEFSTEVSKSENLLQDFSSVSENEKEVIMFVDKDFTQDDGETVENVPPVLELNSHVPFLQLGGQGTSDSSSDVMDEFQQTTIATSTEIKLDDTGSFDRIEEENSSMHSSNSSNNGNVSLDHISTNVTIPVREKNEMNSKEDENQVKSKEGSSNINLDNDATPPTSHIPLTPGDLKILAEYLIKEKIKPAITINSSTYTPNPWLKGNLTSEEKMASIMSAANVSIGIMNQTSSETKVLMPETSTRTNEIIRPEKYEKEAIFKGNSILDSESTVVNKTGSLHNKYNSNRVFHKTYFMSQTELDEALQSNNDYSTTDSTRLEDSSFLTDATTETQTDENIETTSFSPSRNYELFPQPIKVIALNTNSNDVNNDKFKVETLTSEDVTQITTTTIPEEIFRINESRLDLSSTNVQSVSESHEDSLSNSRTDRESLESIPTISINGTENTETTKTQ